MRCRHEDAEQFTQVNRLDERWWAPHSERTYTVVEQRRCLDCHAWLPLGHSDETPERVAVEIRAAELATAWEPEGGVSRIIDGDEAIGWNGWPYRQPENESQHTGFLAAQIRNHERDVIGVNWAGHHMADHPINKETP